MVMDFGARPATGGRLESILSCDSQSWSGPGFRRQRPVTVAAQNPTSVSREAVARGCERLRISPATTANPIPVSPARAAGSAVRTSNSGCLLPVSHPEVVYQMVHFVFHERPAEVTTL